MKQLSSVFRAFIRYVLLCSAVFCVMEIYRTGGGSHIFTSIQRENLFNRRFRFHVFPKIEIDNILQKSFSTPLFLGLCLFSRIVKNIAKKSLIWEMDLQGQLKKTRKAINKRTFRISKGDFAAGHSTEVYQRSSSLTLELFLPYKNYKCLWFFFHVNRIILKYLNNLQYICITDD